MNYLPRGNLTAIGYGVEMNYNALAIVAILLMSVGCKEIDLQVESSHGPQSQQIGQLDSEDFQTEAQGPDFFQTESGESSL